MLLSSVDPRQNLLIIFIIYVNSRCNCYEQQRPYNKELVLTWRRAGTWLPQSSVQSELWTTSESPHSATTPV